MDKPGDIEETEYERYVREKEIRKREKGKPKPRKPLKRTRLNLVSKKQKKRNREYKKAREKHYENEENRSCAICGATNHLSIHHSRGRGRFTERKETFITLCCLGDTFNKIYPELNSCGGIGCHGGVEANHNWARENGYLDT